MDPVPLGCASKDAMQRCGTWQGNNPCLHPSSCLAPFGAATRFTLKRQQALVLDVAKARRHRFIRDFLLADMPTRT